MLDKGWKFQTGDNPAYALPGYDDSKWQPINPTLDIFDLPQMRSTSVSWLRIRFRVDSTLLNKPLAFQIRQHLASEIYLNGAQVKKYGVVSAKSTDNSRPTTVVRAFRYSVYKTGAGIGHSGLFSA